MRHGQGRLIRWFRFGTSLLAAALLHQQAYAKPWIGPDELVLRHHIELLSASGVLTTPTTQWPLMWGAILPDLRRAQSQQLNDPERQAVDALLSRFDKERQPRSAKVELASSKQERRFLTGFGNNNNAPEYVAVSTEFVSRGWAGQLRVSYDYPDFYQEQTRLDGSYLAKAIGNWGVSIGAIDRWWGAGWQSSLLLSNNARPVPGIALQRNRAHEFESAWLNWLGPWQLQAFAGQMESDRAVPEAKLLGMRLAVKPAKWLEIAASRTAQWGGQGRSESFSSFKDLLIGNDNRGDGGVTVDNEPGNQLGGFDIKSLWAMPWGSQGIYAQFIGEDESGGSPSRYITLLGLSGSVTINTHYVHWFYESTRTTVGSVVGDERFNATYSHGIYTTGYRYKGRSLGASIDGDSELDTIGIDWILPNQSLVSLRVSDVALNIDGGGRGAGGRSKGAGDSLELSYEINLGKLRTKFGYLSIDDGLQLYHYNNGIETAFIEASYRW